MVASARCRRVMLRDVVALQTMVDGHRVVQAGGGHALGTDRRTHQIDRLTVLRQPLAKQEPVQRPEDEALRSARSASDRGDMVRVQALTGQQLQGQRAGMNAQRAQPGASL